MLNIADVALLNDLVMQAEKNTKNKDLKTGYYSLSQKLHAMHKSMLCDTKK